MVTMPRGVRHFRSVAAVDSRLGWHDCSGVTVDQSKAGQLVKHVRFAVHMDPFAIVEARLDRLIIQALDVRILS